MTGLPHDAFQLRSWGFISPSADGIFCLAVVMFAPIPVAARSQVSYSLSHSTATQEGFVGAEGIAVTSVEFGSLRGLIYLAVGFPARIKGY